MFQISFTSSQTDSSITLLRAQEQQQLPPLELFKFTGKPIDWPKFIERIRDQIHNKTTLTDSDRMAYLFQNLDGEAKKAVESLGVTGHSYSAALKTLKRLFGNPESVASAYLKNMLESSYVTSNDRQPLPDYYYQVKACTTWCVKMGQSAILQTPEYLSRAIMRLPMNLRVRWYEHIDSRSGRSTLLEFEKWLCKRVDTSKFIERIRDQIHNKTTLTDSDRMAYLFQNLDGEAKKAVESLGVTGHSYSAALKTLKRLFGNPESVASAYLKNMLESSYVTSNDRQPLRDYYYQVKACTTWCVKMGQSAILQTPEYLSRAIMRLPMNLRVRWYEHIDSRSGRSTLLEFEKWLCNE